MATSPTRMGRVQLRIMEVLWAEGSATARTVTETMCKHAPIAHSTVQTLLRKLEDKGAVAHDTDGRVFMFRPLVAQRDVQLNAVQDIVERMFNGSLSGLVAHLLQHEPISDEELARLREVVADARGASGPDTDR